MNSKEFEVILNKMTEQEFVAFRHRFGGDMDRHGYVLDYIRNTGKYEGQLCGMFDVPTEAEKQLRLAEAGTKAAQDSAAAAADANRIAERANRVAIWACVISGISLVVAIAAAIFAARQPQ